MNKGYNISKDFKSCNQVDSSVVLKIKASARDRSGILLSRTKDKANSPTLRVAPSFIFLLILILPFISTYSQEVQLNLRVLDDHDSPITNATVIINGETDKYKTNSQGKFVAIFANDIIYHLTIFQFGFEKVEIEIPKGTKNFKKTIRLQSLQKTIKAVEVEARREEEIFGIAKLKQIEGAAIYAGKKSEVVSMERVEGNKANANAREVFSKVTGLNIWESDCAGLQLSIGGRGLSPHRTSNFNTRQNGYDISADALGYPESYYMPPLDAIERVEFVRGAGALQYGSQFGGLLNFTLKDGDENSPLRFETKQTLGSFNFINSYNAVGGGKGKWKYYAYYQYRESDCWRPNSDIKLHSLGGNTTYLINANHSIKLDLTHMNYLAQQPGGLTDRDFEIDPQSSKRERNWFKVNWNIAALTYRGKFQNQDRIDVKFFGLKAARRSLGILEPAHRADPGEERNLISGFFNNLGSEVKYLKRLDSLKSGTSILFGGRYYQGLTRNQQGSADTSSSANFNFNGGDPDQINYQFPSQNIAFFVEGIYPITEKLKVVPGVRLERILTESEGTFTTNVYHPLTGELLLQGDSAESKSLGRSIFLAGLGFTYMFKDNFEAYSNLSQNYRAINFNDIRVQNPNFRIDPNIQDEKGYNIDLGFRGRHKEILIWDLNAFLLSYTNRIGVILQVDSSTWQIYQFRSNIADSRNYGIESFAQINLARLWPSINDSLDINVFGNFAYTKSEYFDVNYAGIEGNEVEYVPLINLKFGISARWKRFSMNYQMTHVTEQFTDATNTEFTINAVNGLIPAYSVSDLSAQYRLSSLSFKTGINNLTNNSYFTQRATGYPGPGIIPSANRSFYVTVSAIF